MKKMISMFVMLLMFGCGGGGGGGDTQLSRSEEFMTAQSTGVSPLEMDALSDDVLTRMALESTAMIAVNFDLHLIKSEIKNLISPFSFNITGSNGMNYVGMKENGDYLLMQDFLSGGNISAEAVLALGTIGRCDRSGISVKCTIKFEVPIGVIPVTAFFDDGTRFLASEVKDEIQS